MKFIKVVLLLALAISNLCSALPSSSLPSFNGADNNDPFISPNSVCQKCMHCFHDEKDPSTRILSQTKSMDSHTYNYQTSEYQVNLKLNGNGLKSLNSTRSMTFTTHGKEGGYIVQVTYKKMSADTGYSSTSTETYEDTLKFYSTAICTTDIPDGYLLTDLHSVMVQPIQFLHDSA